MCCICTLGKELTAAGWFNGGPKFAECETLTLSKEGMSEHLAKRMSLPSAETEHSAKTSFAEDRVVVECSSLGTR